MSSKFTDSSFAQSQLSSLVERWRSDDTLTLVETMHVVLATIITLKGPDQAGPSSRPSRGRGRGRGSSCGT
ncbi:hypothetical protein ACS0TY_029333 [Phlomoides rotata]